MEIWKTYIDGYYEVSNLGNVRSIDRVVDSGRGGKMFRKGQPLSRTLNPDGYPTVTLRVNNVKSTPTIHRLVAALFIPNPNGLPQVNHLNGDKGDATVTNLEWVTSSENMLHSYAAGLNSKKGERNTAAKLSQEQVDEIRTLKGLYTGEELGIMFSVNKTTIYKIWNNKLW